MMKQLLVSRMSATQNTFFVVNEFDQAWAEELKHWDNQRKVSFARWLCGHYFGFQTDGLLFIKPDPRYDFAWEFYNSDGSHADMCGNAARCATLYFDQRVQQQSSIDFLTGAGPVKGQVQGKNCVRIEMPPVLEVTMMTVNGQSGVFAHTGVPHFVLELSPDPDIAKKLRKVSDFGPHGANITFIQNLSENALEAVTFERGVEGFTQACGTGAVAAAVAFQAQRGSKEFVTVRMPGGELKIEVGQVNQRPYLTGTVQFEFDLSHWSYDEKF